VRWRRPQPGGRGVAAVPPLAGPWQTWSCRALPPLPCEVVVHLPAGRGPAELEVLDGDDAPLPAVDVELWQPRSELWFRWPGTPVTLLVGSPGLRPPSYEVAAAGGLPASGAAAVATLGPAREGDGGAFARWPRWALLGALGAAAVTLLLVLARALRQPADQPS
jgi:hypothetical protein